MIVLLEGVDCAGKTTLINTFYGDIRKSSHGAYPTPTCAFQAYEKELNQIPEEFTTKLTHIFDRLHVSERIYGSKYHGVYMSDERYEFLESMALNRHMIVILCMPPLEAVLTQWNQRCLQGKELITNESTIIEIYHEYDQIDLYTKLPVVRYDYTNYYNEVYSIKERVIEMCNTCYS